MLEVKDLSFSYGKNRVLHAIDFQVQKGTLVTILGANGSGKTTLLKCLNRIYVPHRGEVSINNSPLKHMRQREIACRISMVPQETNCPFSYEVLDMILMGTSPHLSIGRMPEERDYKKANEVMEFLGIPHLASQTFYQLSGGEKQLVLIARALLQDTDYLIMDEPTSHLDFKNQFKIMHELRRMADSGRGVLTALHDPNLAISFSDRIIILSEGSILACGQTNDVITEENLYSAYRMHLRVTEDKEGKMVFPLQRMA